MSARHSVRAALLAVALSLATASALASPLLGASALPAAAQRALAADLRAARAQHPEHFARVADLAGLRPSVYRASRLQRPSVVRELRAMGRDALMPMLDLLAGAGPSRALTAAERDTLVLASLDALGALRDRRAAPVLQSAFAYVSAPEELRAAARSLAQLGGDSELAALTSAASTPGLRQPAALEALGVTRRVEFARTLTDALSSTDAAVVTGAARGLAELGSTWAQAATAQRVALPRETHAALVSAWLRGLSRSDLSVALSAVATADTLAAIDAAAASASASDARALAQLRRIVARSVGVHHA